ncbi:MAG: hypothetical protein EBY32_19280, partial [Proteobacteria bacterium]|nr:hypothetical protein [Pseudomonadota bacterium]
HAARVGLSLLTAIGRTEWAAETKELYIKSAIALAKDRNLRTQLRASLRAEFTQSIFCDHLGQATRFEAGIRKIWGEWCSKIVGPRE